MLANVSQVRPRASAYALAGGFVAVAPSPTPTSSPIRPRPRRSARTPRSPASAASTSARPTSRSTRRPAARRSRSRRPDPDPARRREQQRDRERRHRRGRRSWSPACGATARWRRPGSSTSAGRIASLALYAQRPSARRRLRHDHLGRRRRHPRRPQRPAAARDRRERRHRRAERGDGLRDRRRVTVSPIVNTGYGNMLFTASDSIGNGTANGSASNPWPVFEFRDTLASVTIVDHSDKTLRIGSINVVNTLASSRSCA